MIRATLRSNAPQKLLAILLALLLYAHVRGRQDPTELRTVTTHLTIRNRPPDVIVASNTDTVDVTLRGRRSALARLTPQSLEARIDVGHIQPGESRLPIRVQVDSALPVWSVEIHPTHARVTCDPIVGRMYTVEIVRTGAAPDAVSIESVSVNPAEVQIRAPLEQLKKVVKVVATVDLRIATQPEPVPVPVVVVDERGRKLESLTPTPSRVTPVIVYRERRITRQVAVLPTIEGQPKAGYRVSEVKAIPAQVAVEGPYSAVAELKGVPTSPISVEGASRSVQRLIDLRPPATVTVRDTNRARVQIEIEPTAEETGNENRGDAHATRRRER